MGIFKWIIIFILVGIAVGLLVTNIRIVPQARAYVVERLGAYHGTWQVGLHFKIPVIDKIARKVSLKEKVIDFPPQPVITKDNVTINIDTVVFYSVFDARSYTYGVENPVVALSTLTATTLRNIIGSLELDETLTSRDIINAKMQGILDEATDKWGIKVSRVELKNIVPPRDIQEAMEKQMRAEREKRQTLLEAEAHKESAVARAEGDKRAAILKAEADRDSAIARATGQAESIKLVYEAEAEGLERLAKAQISEAVLTLRKLDALKSVADGKATKLVVPTELAGVVSSLSLIGDTFKQSNAIETIKEDIEAPVDECCSDNERSEVTKGFVKDKEK